MIESAIAFAMTVFPLVFTSNLVVSLVKWMSFRQESATFLRTVLVVVSLLGVITSAALSGQPVDFNQLSELGKMLLETATVALAAHASYKAIKNA